MMKKTGRDAIIEHATRTKHIVQDPSSFLTELVVQQQQYHSLQWLCHFDVLTSIPLPPGSLLYSDVALRAKVPASTLRSVARMAMTMGFLCETEDGRLSHNALSAPFVSDVHARRQLQHMFNQTVPIMGGLATATEKWGETTAPNETAYNIIMQTDLPFFEHLKSRPDLNENFDSFMKSRAVSHTGSRAEYMLDSFDWKALGKAIIVDVGGSSGSTAIMLAAAHPELQLVVEDLPGPVNNARSKIALLPEDIRGRINVTEYDFFTPQPHTGADVYLLRTIIHDWPDADAIRILRNIIEAMQPSSRLLIMDMVLPKPDSGSRTLEAALRQKDLTMIQAFNSKEREEDEWKVLLAKADSRLKVLSIRRPEGSELSLIEVALEHDIGAEMDGSMNGGIKGVNGNSHG